jgi:multiple sugar transport system permease protein
MSVKAHAGRLANALVLVLAVITVLVPLAMVAAGSFEPSTEFYAGLGTAHTWTVANYLGIFAADSSTDLALNNSLVITLVSTLVTVLAGGAAAYALFRLGARRWVEVLLLAILAVRFYPKIALILPYYLFMRALGLLDTRIGVILVYVSITLPFAILVMETFYRGLPREMLEAAVVDGASEWSIFTRIAFPLSIPAAAGAAVLTAFVCWNEFLIVSSLTTQNAVTLPVVLSTFITDKGINLGGLSALEMIIIVPMVILVLVSQRYIVNGLTAGAVKG